MAEKVLRASTMAARHSSNPSPDSWPGDPSSKQRGRVVKKKRERKRRIRGGGEFKCDVCSKIYTRQDGLRLHKRIIHSGEQPYPCQECGLSLSSKQALKYHKTTHSGAFLFVCEECGAGYRDQDAFNGHVLKHSGDKPTFLCKSCGLSFFTFKKLRKHEVYYHEEKLEKYSSCEKCGRRFKDRKSFNFHLKRHDICPFVCGICPRMLTTQQELEQHELTHKKHDKKYKCSFCEKSFSNSSNQVKHERLHTGEKPFVCLQCGKLHRDPSNLKAHMRKVHKDVQKDN